MKEVAINSKFENFHQIIEILRGPEGCPWDRKQSLSSLRKFLIEECYEAVSAINQGDMENLKEELGDVLLIVLMMSVIADEERGFSIDDVIRDVTAKIVRRHPHVFGNESIQESEQVVSRWEEIKRQEKPREETEESPSAAFIPNSVPELERAYRIQKAAAKVDFDWQDAEPVIDKVQEEIEELKAARIQGDGLEEEVGDLLFSVVNLSRKLGIHPALALHGTNEKFIKRFSFIEERMKRDDLELQREHLDKMEKYWEESKSAVDNKVK